MGAHTPALPVYDAEPPSQLSGEQHVGQLRFAVRVVAHIPPSGLDVVESQTPVGDAMHVRGHDHHSGRRGIDQPLSQEVNQHEVTEVVDPEQVLKALGRLGPRGQGEAGVAHHHVEMRESVEHLVGAAAYRSQISQVEAHHLRIRPRKTRGRYGVDAHDATRRVHQEHPDRQGVQQDEEIARFRTRIRTLRVVLRRRSAMARHNAPGRRSSRRQGRRYPGRHAVAAAEVEEGGPSWIRAGGRSGSDPLCGSRGIIPKSASLNKVHPAEPAVGRGIAERGSDPPLHS